MDVTNGRGIAPVKVVNPLTGKFRFFEYEEYRENVPKPLKRLNSPYGPDEVADMLGLEDSNELYRWLEYKQTSMSEAEYYESEGEAFLEREEELAKKIFEIRRDAKDERYNRLPATVDEKIKLVKQYLEKNPAVARKTLSSGTSDFKRVRVGAPMIMNFLGWNLTKVQESLERINLIDKGIVDPNALYLFPTQASAINFAKAVKKFGLKNSIRKKQQKDY